MSNSVLKSCSFSLNSLHEQAQELSIQFHSDENSSVSTKKFHFIPEVSSIEEGEILDVYSQNGICQELFFSKLFQKRDVAAAQKISTVVQNWGEQGVKLFVLDVKGENTGYLRCRHF